MTEESPNIGSTVHYPILGPNTTPADYDEAMFVRSRTSTSYRDIKRYKGLASKNNYKDGEWTKVTGDDDFVTAKALSPAGKRMQAAIAKSVSDAEANKLKQQTFVRPNEDQKDHFYRKWNQTFREFTNDSRTSLTQLREVDNAMSVLFDSIRAQKTASYRSPTRPKRKRKGDSVEFIGNYGDATPDKPRKRRHI